VREALRQVIDPELGVNIVDLGLVRGVAVAAGRARITMTLTTPGCPMGASIIEAVETAVEILVPDVDAVDIDLVWDPPWCFDCISEAGREELGWR
jgi:metal-sulfur cluster biosynthetic enzyme